MPQVSQLLLNVLLLGASSSAAMSQTLVEIQTGIPAARFVHEYSMAERARTAKRILGLSSPLSLGPSISLTPDAAFAQNGSHLSFWNPSFVIATKSGGEAGINFWERYEQGHMNVGLPAQANQHVLLDCRIISDGDIAYKIYRDGATPNRAGRASLVNRHLLLDVAAGATSIEIWPARERQIVGILGCSLNTILETHT